MCIRDRPRSSAISARCSSLANGATTAAGSPGRKLTSNDANNVTRNSTTTRRPSLGRSDLTCSCLPHVVQQPEGVRCHAPPPSTHRPVTGWPDARPVKGFSPSTSGPNTPWTLGWDETVHRLQTNQMLWTWSAKRSFIPS